MALYWDIFGVHKGETHLPNWHSDLNRFFADNGFDCFDTFCRSSLILFLRASTILTPNVIGNMERCGGKCVLFDINEERIYHSISHATIQAVTESLQYLLLHYKVVRWQTACDGYHGYSYDQNNLGQGVLFCLHQQTGKEKTFPKLIPRY